MPTNCKVDNSANLASTVRNVWIGDEWSTIPFEGTLPSSVGIIETANVFLFFISTDNSTDNAVSYSSMIVPSDIELVGNEYPILVFDKCVPHPINPKNNHSKKISSYLTSSNGTVGMTVKLHLASLPDHVDAIQICLQFQESSRTFTRKRVSVYSNIVP